MEGRMSSRDLEQSYRWSQGQKMSSSAQSRERRGKALTSLFLPSSSLLPNLDRNQWQEAWETHPARERQRMDLKARDNDQSRDQRTDAPQ